MKPADVKHIALMQLKAIGETLMCEPSIAAIRREYPKRKSPSSPATLLMKFCGITRGSTVSSSGARRPPLFPYLGFLWRLRKPSLRISSSICSQEPPQPSIRLADPCQKGKSLFDLRAVILASMGFAGLRLDTLCPDRKAAPCQPHPEPARIAHDPQGLLLRGFHRQAANAIFAKQGTQIAIL